jgi:Na+-transporting methylmalonyl-CoA/oxaloacetate decarboxylase gamma subunit
MSIGEMFGQSAILALLGMSVVFAFLIILVWVVSLVKRLVMAMKWDGDVIGAAAPAGQVGPAVAAASAAVSAYRKTH